MFERMYWTNKVDGLIQKSMSEMNFVATDQHDRGEENSEVEQNLNEETRRSTEMAHEKLFEPHASDCHLLVYKVFKGPEQVQPSRK